MKLGFLVLVCLLVAGVILMRPPIPQDPAYHQFADQRSWAALPNVWNLLSNLPYVLIGIFGWWRLRGVRPAAVIDRLRFVYRLIFIGLVLVGLGSFHYHWAPDNLGLLWDRLAIALVICAFFTIVLAEYLDERTALLLFPLLLFIAPASAVYWYWTETLGQGDLRLYGLVQFLPLLLVPLILLLFSSPMGKTRHYWLVLAGYALAKLFEVGDAWVFDATGVISGHTLKHLFSAAGAWMLVRSLDAHSPHMDAAR
jgi:hypothetical protein